MTTPWVDFETIKRTVSLEMVLKHYRIELRSGGPGTLRGKCPLPMHGSKESRASFTATLTKGVGGVWACQSASCIKARDGSRGGNALDFVATMECCSIREAAEKMSEWFGVARTGTPAAGGTSKAAAPQPVSTESRDSGATINKPLAFTLQGIEHKHPYLENRGVDETTARKFGVGYFPGRGSMQNRIVIPIHNEGGDLVAYAGRSIDESEPRYKLPPGFHKSLELYNIHRAIRAGDARCRVVVVEGFFDCLRVSAAGFPCLALMGSSMSSAQEDLLVRHFKVACILLDSDGPGQQGAIDCLKRLGRRMWVWAPTLPQGTQPDMLAAEDIQALLKR
jgi:DNA primase